MVRTFSKGGVCPILLDLQSTELTGPLSHLQGSGIGREDFEKLAGTINGRFPANEQIKEDRLEKSFDLLWPQIDDEIQRAIQRASEEAPPAKERTQEDLLREVLEVTRSIQRTLEAMNGVPGGADRATAALKTYLEGLSNPTIPDIEPKDLYFNLLTKPLCGVSPMVGPTKSKKGTAPN